MKAELLFHRKNIEANGDIVEMTLWKVPHSKDKPHGLKYSLVYIHDGNRIVGYDNAEGRGDHRHYGHREQRYEFQDVDTLIGDFMDDVERARRGGA
ncbi:MAG: toxin-antitoxin system TumE family protein [Nitrospirota bacterium]